MNFFTFKKFIKNLRHTTLSSDEKGDLRRNFIARAGLTTPSHKVGVFGFLASARFQYAVVVCLVVILSTSGVVFSAERALPGDVLYPVKTKVTEPIARAFHAQSPEAQAIFEADLIDTRLNEAEQLDQQKQLSPERKRDIQVNVIEQTDRAEKVANTDDTVDKVEQNSKRIEKVLNKHQNIIKVLENKEHGNKDRNKNK